MDAIVSAECPKTGELCRYREAVAHMISPTEVTEDPVLQIEYEAERDKYVVDFVNLSEERCFPDENVCGIAVTGAAFALFKKAEGRAQYEMAQKYNEGEAQD